MRPVYLFLDLQLEHSSDDDDQQDKENNNFKTGDVTFRSNGVSIGRDYFRFEGKTWSRGELNSEYLKLQEIIGRGAFSTVYRGIWNKPKQQRQHQQQKEQKLTVAIKQFSLEDCSPKRKEMLLKELQTLCKVDSSSLIQLHGAFLKDDIVTLTLEYMDQGSLQDFLKIRKRSSPNNPLSEPLIASVTYQVLFGLAHLHELVILHRDLKPANILLSSDGSVKLCDFGMAAIRYNDNNCQSMSSTVLGTTHFMAPERLRARKYGRSSDIWSFGLILLCCIDCLPWKDISSIVELVITVEDTNFVDVTHRLQISKSFREIMILCLQHDPAKRMPSKLLLQSPWFSSHGIASIATARENTKHIFTKHIAGRASLLHRKTRNPFEKTNTNATNLKTV